MAVVPFPSWRFTPNSRKAVFCAAYRLIDRGLANCVASYSGDAGRELIWVLGAYDAHPVCGFGRRRDGTYFMMNAQGRNVAASHSVDDVIAVIP